MSGSISGENLEKAIENILSEYGDEVSQVLGDVIEDVVKDSAKELKAFNQGRRPWKHYPKGWTYKIKKGRIDIEGVVHNKDHYRLTHLLEFGHAKRNGGRTAAFPHIAEVNEYAQKEVLKRLEEKLAK